MTESAAYTYDLQNRLSTSNQTTNSTSAQRRFVYDRFGNRTAVYDATSGGNQIQSISLTTTLVPPMTLVANNKIASLTSGSTTKNYSYDNAGNVTNDSDHSYTYDAENRLVSVDSGNTASYSYDHHNRRIKKTVGSTTTVCIWEGSQVVAEYDQGTSSLQAEYIYSGSRMIAKFTSSATRYFLSDKASVRLVLDTSGNIVGRQAHLPFGEEMGTSGEQEKRRFTTYERDGESGLDYAINRSESPKLGRFMSADPFKQSGNGAYPQSWNRFTYVQNDPINSSDPTGLSSCQLWGTFAIYYRNGIPVAAFLLNTFYVCNASRAKDPDAGGGSAGGTSQNDTTKLGPLNLCEAKLLALQLALPLGAIDINDLIWAKEIADAYEAANGGPQDDNDVNARKHCIWSCELTKRLGPKKAEKWTNAHESNDKCEIRKGSDSTDMDLHNNWIGRKLATDSETKDQDCATACQKKPVGDATSSDLRRIR